MDNNQLLVKIKESDVNQETALSLQNTFMPFFQQAEEWAEKAKGIVVTDVSQVKEMTLARESRLALKNIRIEVDKKRKEMKAESLRKGKAIDGMANVIKYLIEPIEEDLKKKEDFVIEIEKKRKQELRDKRIAALEQYEVDCTFYNLAEMPQDGYIQLLENSKIAFDTKKTVEKKIEDDRIVREKAEIVERERIKKENERLKKEANDMERIRKIEIEKQTTIEYERKAEMEMQKKHEEKEREIFEAKLKKEREEKERIQAEMKTKEEAEEKRKEAEIEAIEKAEAADMEAERKQKAAIEKEKHDKDMAPDRDKLQDFAIRITQIELPEVKSQDAKNIIASIVDLLNSASNEIKKAIINL